MLTLPLRPRARAKSNRATHVLRISDYFTYAVRRIFPGENYGRESQTKWNKDQHQLVNKLL